DVVNAGKEPVTTIPGASFFDSAMSFAMIRGGHIDVAVLGAMQVSVTGDLANWSAGRETIRGIGGAVGPGSGGRGVIVVMMHRDKFGQLKLGRRCTLPLSALGAVSTVVTEVGVFEVDGGRFVVRELAPGFVPDSDLQELLS